MITRILTTRWMHILLLIALLAGFVGLRRADPAYVRDLRQLTFDAYNRHFPRKSGDPTVILDIDEASLAKYGQWPWPRTLVAQLIDKLNEMGASSIVFDMVFAEADRSSPGRLAASLPDMPELAPAREALMALPDNDDVLAKSIASAGNVVLGIVAANEDTGRAPPENAHFCIDKFAYDDPLNPLRAVDGRSFFATALPVLVRAAAGNGSFTAAPDSDGVIRRVPLMLANRNANGNNVQINPALSMEGLRVAMRDRDICYDIKMNPPVAGQAGSIAAIELRERREIQGMVRTKLAYRIPVDGQGNIIVYYSGARKGLYVSIADLLDGRVPADDIRGKVAIIGTSAIGLKDIRSTPLSTTLPGVELHSEIIDQVLQGHFIERPRGMKEFELIVTIVLCLGIIFIAPFAGTVTVALVVFLMIAGGVFASVLAYQKGIQVDVLYPSIAILSMFILSSILTNLRTELKSRMIRQAFDRYLSPALIEELVKDPDKLKLGGEVRELTVMFTDIRNFTTISESMDPAELIRMMNDFLTPMTSAVLDNKGFVDKYMGDAMMTFWNAPVDTPDHAESACRAALEMVNALKPVNEELKARAEAAQRPFHELKAGIGINSGQASVGNMGSKQRFAYSALGDTVNLASRLEGQTKNYGVSVMISDATRSAAASFATIELDLLTVKGRTEPERVHTLLGGPEIAENPDFVSFRARHDSMLAAYRAKKWDEAEKAAGECIALQPELEVLYRLYISRIAAYRQNPPPANWSGVWVAKDK